MGLEFQEHTKVIQVSVDVRTLAEGTYNTISGNTVVVSVMTWHYPTNPITRLTIKKYVASHDVSINSIIIHNPADEIWINNNFQFVYSYSTFT